jgi:HD superfamily phosphohydrolase
MDEQKTKRIKDCIHGHVKVQPLCVAYMDRPEFQRLRRIKQLGNVSRVYPSATHTRFEHSIGVMHLAGEMCHALNVNNERVVHLIQLAGLYHDVGHLPYSHLFDEILERNNEHHSLPTSHEERSICIFQRVSQSLGLLNQDEIFFVCACIRGEQPVLVESLLLSNGVLLDSDYHQFLYQIVSSNVDVDRLDYLCRDAYHTNMPSFQANYIILNARIHPKTHRLVFRKHAKLDIENMFQMRERMHHLVYQHRVSLKHDTLYMYMLNVLFEAKVDFGLNDQLCDYKLDAILLTHPLTREIYQRMESREEIVVDNSQHKEKWIPSCETNVSHIVFI